MLKDWVRQGHVQWIHQITTIHFNQRNYFNLLQSEEHEILHQLLYWEWQHSFIIKLLLSSDFWVSQLQWTKLCKVVSPFSLASTWTCNITEKWEAFFSPDSRTLPKFDSHYTQLESDCYNVAMNTEVSLRYLHNLYRVFLSIDDLLRANSPPNFQKLIKNWIPLSFVRQSNQIWTSGQSQLKNDNLNNRLCKQTIQQPPSTFSMSLHFQFKNPNPV